MVMKSKTGSGTDCSFISDKIQLYVCVCVRESERGEWRKGALFDLDRFDFCHLLIDSFDSWVCTLQPPEERDRDRDKDRDREGI